MPAYINPVFIVGMPRSGTTLIQGILCNTGQYFPIPETHFFDRATYDLPEDNLSNKDRKRIQRKLLIRSRIKLDQKIPESLTTTKDIFEHVIDQFNHKGSRTFLEKTPRHVFFYSKILEYYPNAKFICMIREPKNVVRSQLTNSPLKKLSVIRISLLYNKIAAALVKIRNHDNTLMVKYEELITETEIILKRTCEFLNIGYDSKLIDNVAAPPGIVAEHESWKNRNIRYKTIQKASPAKWEKAFDYNQENLVNFITRSYAAQFGYALKYSRKALYKGFYHDMKNLLTLREFKKVIMNIHG